MMSMPDNLTAHTALRIQDAVAPDRLATELRQAWYDLGTQRCAVHWSVSEPCARSSAQRAAEAWRLLTLETHTPFWDANRAGLRATLIVVDAQHGHLLLLTSCGGAGRRALQRLQAQLAARYRSTPVPLPESHATLPPPAIRIRRAKLLAA